MPTQSRRFPPGLIALALGGFGIGLTEFGIVGLLPEIARDFSVSEPVAGYLVSGYAIAVAVGAIVVTAALTRVKRKHVLISLMALFILGNLVSALAPDYAFLLAGRVLAALCHGAFFGVGAVVAADMVAEERKAGAISLMFAGLTVANVAGVPLGTFVGDWFGWRSTFWAITVIGVIALFGIQILVKGAAKAAGGGMLSEVGALRRPQVLLSALVSVLTFGALVGAYAYIAFTLTKVSGISEGAVPLVLLLFGVGTFVGNLTGGRLADRALDPTMLAILGALIVVLAGFGLVASIAWAALVAMFLLGVVGFATAPGLQLRVMRYAGDAPTMASGANIAALNLGNAFGAWLGGIAIALGLGYSSPLWVGSALAATALLVLTIAKSVSTNTAADQHFAETAVDPTV